MGTQKKEEVYLLCSLQDSVVWGGVSSGEAVLADGEEGKPKDGSQERGPLKRALACSLPKPLPLGDRR